MISRLLLLNMGVIVDMILAVTVVAVTPRAVPEFQFGIAQICSAADSTLMGVGGFHCGSSGLVRAGKLNRGVGGFGGFRFLPEEPGEIYLPRHRNHIGHILTEEQEIVCQGNQGEQVVGENIRKYTDKNQHQVNQCKDPGLHRDEEKQKEMGIGI